MATRKKTKPISGAASMKSILAASAALESLADQTAVAVTAVAKEKKSLLTQSKRLAKKRATLARKKKAVANRLKKDPSAANRKEARAVDKDLAVVKKESAKVSARKSLVSDELGVIKAAARRATAYHKAIVRIDKSLG